MVTRNIRTSVAQEAKALAWKRCCGSLVVSWVLAGSAYGNTGQLSALAELNLEDLGNIEITSVSKYAQRLQDAAAAVYVITQEDIRRSGATSIAEALRLAPNLQVARYASNGYAISARGFNTTTTNKLLVLIDGRSVYTPLYSGVFWDVQDTLIGDIERIEVISGPGASLWGANAVNGVINVITRNAADTQGTLATLRVGSEEKTGSVRYGGKTEEGTAYRMYTKYFDRGASVNAAGSAKRDAWDNGQAGFRVDHVDNMQAKQRWTAQGDIYRGSSEQATYDDRHVEGANLLGRWSSDLEQGHLQIQGYFDHTKRDQPGLFAESLDSFDLDVQHRFNIGNQQTFLWGGGYRYSSDRVQTSTTLAFLPGDTHLSTANFFVQDQITLIPNTVQLSLGTKFERNNYSGWDIQPDARLSWRVSDQHQLWGALSRAARAPSRFDRDLYIPGPPATPILNGGPEFTSEILTAYQLGYKGQWSSKLSLSATVFYNDYKKLRSLDRDATTGIYTINNHLEGTSQGVELWGELRPTQRWRVYAGYTYLDKNLRLLPGASNPSGTATEGNDPRHQLSLRSLLDLPYNLELDSMVRHISALPNPGVPAYTAFDVRLGWKPSKQWELALVAQNLFDDQHPEFGSASNRSEIQRNIFIKSTWKF